MKEKIQKIRPNTDILIQGASRITTRFPACLAKHLRLGQTFDIVMLDRNKPMRGRVTGMERVKHGIDVSLVLFKSRKKISREKLPKSRTER